MLRYERPIRKAITDICYRGMIVYDLDPDLDLSLFYLHSPSASRIAVAQTQDSNVRFLQSRVRIVEEDAV